MLDKYLCDCSGGGWEIWKGKRNILNVLLMFKLGEQSWIAKLFSSHIEEITVLWEAVMGRTHSEILFSFSTQSLSESSASCLLSPPTSKKEKKKGKALISVPWQMPQLLWGRLEFRMPLIQVPEEANWSIVRGECGCVESHISCFEVQIGFLTMMETTLIRWNTMFANVHSARWSQMIESGSCLLFWHGACCASAARLFLHGCIASPSLQWTAVVLGLLPAGWWLLCFLHWS